MSTLLLHHDYKYEASIWRQDLAESFQKRKTVKTEYTVGGGQVVETVETTWTFDSAIAARSPQLPDPPTTFIYVDGTYRADEAYIFQKTQIKTTTYSAYGASSYQVNVDIYNVLTGQTTHSTSIIDGKIPLAPTISSSLTNLIQQPLSGTLDDNCDFIPATTTIDSGYIQDADEAAFVAKRRMQRATAIVRRLKHAANPMMKLGQTIQLVDGKRSLDGRHVFTGRTVAVNEAGDASETLQMEFWTR